MNTINFDFDSSVYNTLDLNSYYDFSPYTIENFAPVKVTIEKPQAGMLSVIPIEILTIIFSALDLRSLGNVGQSSHYLKELSVHHLKRCYPREVQAMISILLKFCAGDNEKHAICHSLSNDAKILNSNTLYEIKLMNIFPEYQRPYLMWFTFHNALEHNKEIALTILSFIEKQTAGKAYSLYNYYHEMVYGIIGNAEQAHYSKQLL